MEQKLSVWAIVLRYAEMEVDDFVLCEEDHSEIDLIEDLGLDSMRIMALIVEIEEAYDIEIEDEYLSFEAIRYFGRLSELVEKMEAKQDEKKCL